MAWEEYSDILFQFCIISSSN